MASRQNLSSRKVGNEEEPKQTSFGRRATGPGTGLTPEQQAARAEERRRMLAQEPTPEERRAAIEEHIARGREETRRRAEDTNEESRNARTSAPRPDHQTSGTKDITARGAGRRIAGRERQIDDAVESQVRGRDEEYED